jgi:hypothetical protein
MKKNDSPSFLLYLLIVLTGWCGWFPVSVQAQSLPADKPISSDLFGLFFEDIN